MEIWNTAWVAWVPSCRLVAGLSGCPTKLARNAFCFPTFDVVMKRYFFDLRDGDVISPDEEGMESPDIEAVQEEAARSLADVAKDAVRSRGRHVFGHWMAIEVRDDTGPVLVPTFLGS